MITEKKPAILRLIQIDYGAFVAAIFPIIFWLFYGYDRFIEKSHNSTIIYLAGAATIISVVVLTWRYLRILSLYRTGLIIKANISNIEFFRDKGRIGYIYNFQGHKYLRGNIVMKTKLTKGFEVGEEVEVLLDPDRPRRAVIKNLYD